MVNKKKAEKRERNRCFKIWTAAVKERDHGKCCICGETFMLNSHHIIPREVHALRFDIMNGCSLCPTHHQFSRELSAHHNSFAFCVWLMNNRPEQFAYLKQSLNMTDDSNNQQMKGGNMHK